ncbi:Ig-like domain-containing protein [Pontibacter sp. 172403-2]|uniref:Ig-like domain-containing protein n=1 Tax=Pontibacter rufus TaxID=2791028 RepID=UPI0018AFB6BA|nr:Ig-like domain-containing protein [Pontibacter sp. 172403-2]
MKKRSTFSPRFLLTFYKKKAVVLLLIFTGLVVTVIAAIGSGPYVISSTPPDGATHVSVNVTSIAANNLYVPEESDYLGGVNNATINHKTVKLQKIVKGAKIDVLGVVQGTGGGDAISFSPTYPLEPSTKYKFTITSGVKSYSGASFAPYEAVFETGAAKTEHTGNLHVAFTKVPIPGTQNRRYTTLTFGPDGKLYALRLDGTIERFKVNHANGMLSRQAEIATLVNKYGERSAIGLTFDPASTADSLVAYVSHSSAGLEKSPEFDSKISRLSGPELEKEQLLVTKLPRSNKDHMINSLVFGPDSALYFSQGSNTSMGAYDSFWQREESLLSGAVLRLDMKKLSKIALPLNVMTSPDQQIINNAPEDKMLMADGTYNPYSASSPLTIYASGVRNAYDLVWHSNGQLYIPANGSAAGGNTPASVAGTRRPNGTFYNGPKIPATSSVVVMSRWILRKLFRYDLVNALFPSVSATVQNDWLFRVNPLKPVGYFGHPNPLRGEYVVNRGYTDNLNYPASVMPDANYRGSAYNFGLNKSPDGVLEYKSNAFNGALKGKLLVTRFSGGSDIIILEPGSMVKNPKVTSAGSDDSVYDIVRATTGMGASGVTGMSGFANPLDIVEDVKTGNLYVSEFNRQDDPEKAAQITLLRVKDLPEPGTVMAQKPNKKVQAHTSGQGS